MVFNFPPPFSKRNTCNVIQEQHSNPHPANFSQPPPSSESTQRDRNYGIPRPQAVPAPSNDSTQHRRNYGIPPRQAVPTPSNDSTQHRGTYGIPPPQAVPAPNNDSTQHRRNYGIPPPRAISSPSTDSIQQGRNYGIPPPQAVPQPSTDLTQQGRNYGIPPHLAVSSLSTDSTQRERNYGIPPPQAVPSPSTDLTQRGRNYGIPTAQAVPSPSIDSTQQGRNYGIPPPQPVPPPSTDLTPHRRNDGIPPPSSADSTRHRRNYGIPPPQAIPSPSSDSTQHGTNYSIPPPQAVPSQAYQQQSFPRWQQPNEMPMSWNATLPPPTRPPFQHYDQENHPTITSGTQPGNHYPFAGNSKLIPSDQADKSVALPDDPVECKAWDETWLQNWLSRRRTNTTVPPTEKEASKALKVHQAREILKKCCSLIQNLENSHQELLADKDNITNEVWQDKWRHISEMQKQIASQLTTVSVADNMIIKKTLAKRKKKRLAQKRRKELYQINQKKNFLKQQELHENINAWLKNMEEVVEKTKREESLKHEADLVLGEVTRKKTEARRQLSLLSVLLKLRQIRAQSSANRGQPVAAESSARFIKVIEHLQKLWEDQLRDYNVEEQGLRVMLEEAVEERTQSYEKQAVAEWDRVLFGNKSYAKFRNFYLTAENDTEAFLAIRKSWDKYLAPSDAVMSSAIPVGWVLPTNPSSSVWEKHLKSHY